MKILYKVWRFIKAPIYVRLVHIQNPLKLKIVSALLAWGIILSLVVAIFNEWLIGLLGIDLGEHAIETFLEKYSVISLFFMAAVLAPIVEETLFRGPLIWFRNNKYFKYILYLSILLFAGVHLSNFEMTKQIYYVAPLLVLPQLILGAFLSYVRVTLGLRWSICLHATYNAILVSPVLLYKLLKIPLE
ncbi:CPBP family intramembrane metalloprotease [Arenibacter sp. N53]|uniref:CPBP family intramembrane glutamic endopeptidase n=1 Tax=Arenibacter TaxID=178469 RepID=UPI000CD3C903|nr:MULTISPECIES: CPBP family intramembrane glutamic endopeptidase [Arenibacter]MCM4152269.1 CPBP family intramembrane metalloprotease [Arenibacter sp. N53]